MTIEQIHIGILQALQDGGIEVSDSSTSRRSMYAGVVASCFYTQYKLQQQFKAEMNQLELERERYRSEWYAKMGLNFQLGFNLVEGYDYFDNTGHTEQEIADSKVVKHIAIVEQQLTTGRILLYIKVAGDTGAGPVQLDGATVAAISAYFSKIKILGTRVIVQSLAPDNIKMEWDVYYNPLILNPQGARLDGLGNTPVQDSIKNYLKNLPFYKGKYSIVGNQDEIQNVDGVAIPIPKAIYTKSANGVYNLVNVEYQTDAGWLRFLAEEDLIINFIPYQ